jgi:hypothetical protein
MKKLNYILLAGIALFATACTNDEDDLFDKSAAQRMNELVLSNTELLESSENGWVFNYYIGHDDISYGGLVHTIRFKDGKSYFRSEAAADPTEEYASLYQVKGEQECLLSFDTYNAVFHYLTGPISSSYPDGLESDYEFTFKSISANQDTITLKGKKYGVYAQLVRLKSDGSEFMTQIADMSEKINAFPRSFIVAKGDTIDVLLNDGVLEYSTTESAPSTDDSDATEETSYVVPYITTITGLHFYSPVTINGVTFQECTYNESNKVLEAVGVDAYFPVILPEGYLDFEDLLGEYTVGFSSTVGSSNAGTRDITIKDDGTGKGFIISGMTYSGNDIAASYNSAYGSIDISVQYIGLYSTYQVWICVYYGGYYNWSTSLGMTGRNSTVDGKTVISFTSNNSSYAITTLHERAFSGTPSSSTAAGWITRFADPLTFTKK